MGRSKRLLLVVFALIFISTIAIVFVSAEQDIARMPKSNPLRILWDRITSLFNDLQTQINNIQLTPGPQGEQGPKGDTGPQGPQGPAGKDTDESAIYKAIQDGDTALQGQLNDEKGNRLSGDIEAIDLISGLNNTVEEITASSLPSMMNAIGSVNTTATTTSSGLSSLLEMLFGQTGSGSTGSVISMFNPINNLFGVNSFFDVFVEINARLNNLQNKIDALQSRIEALENKGACVPSTEVCNGVDDDCDGSVDEGGVCGNVCTPSTEVCNGLDDDCNGQVDEFLSRACYTGSQDTRGIGLCHAGTQTCSDEEWGSCSGEVLPSPEICDHLDNNCNNAIDETFPQLGYSCNVGVGGCMRTGIGICSADKLSVVCSATAGTSQNETCNGRDDDCDGSTDEESIAVMCPVAIPNCAYSYCSGSSGCVYQSKCTGQCHYTYGCGFGETCTGHFDNYCTAQEECAC